MAMLGTTESSDPLVLPYLRARDEAEAVRLLSQLISEHAAPVIHNVIKSKLHVSLSHDDGSHANQDALDVDSEVRSLLVAELSQLRAAPDSKSINNFLGYVAVVASNACSAYLRRKYPQRHRLRHRLRYLLNHRPAFALWQGRGKEWLCGLAKWRDQRQAVALAGFLDRLRLRPQAFAPAGAAGANEAQCVPLADCLILIFQATDGPVELDDLVSTVAELWGVKDYAVRNATDDEREDNALERLPDPRAGVEAEVEQRLYLERLWEEICQLPLRQRTALLLNLRDAEGRGCIALLPLTNVATVRQIAAALDFPAERLAALWNDLPLDDAAIARQLGLTSQQVINLRKSARARLARRMKGF